MAADALRFRFEVDGENFTSAGEASVEVKKKRRQLGFAPEVIRRVSIAMYEGEINMVIHAGGGEAVITVDPDRIVIVLEDHGPGMNDHLDFALVHRNRYAAEDVYKRQSRACSRASIPAISIGGSSGITLSHRKGNRCV